MEHWVNNLQVHIMLIIFEEKKNDSSSIFRFQIWRNCYISNKQNTRKEINLLDFSYKPQMLIMWEYFLMDQFKIPELITFWELEFTWESWNNFYNHVVNIACLIIHIEREKDSGKNEWLYFFFRFTFCK